MSRRLRDNVIIAGCGLTLALVATYLGYVLAMCVILAFGL